MVGYQVVMNYPYRSENKQLMDRLELFDFSRRNSKLVTKIVLKGITSADDETNATRAIPK